MNINVSRIGHFKLFSWSLFGVLLFCYSSCLVSNHLFVPQDANKKSEDVIKGNGYAFECYAMYAIEDILEIDFKTNVPDEIKIYEVKVFWINEQDTVYARLRDNYKNTYRFQAPKIKKRRHVSVLVEFGLDQNSTQSTQIHPLKKIRDYSFAIH